VKAAIYDQFARPLAIRPVPDPTPPEGGVVLRVRATGICRSDWHGWMGHDPSIRLPHVPGHELAGVVEAVGLGVARWKPGDRVTLPFVAGCGHCPQCLSGNHQICDHQFQPGFTHWGSFAPFVAIRYADINLVRLPEQVDFATAASLGCRFATSFRAVVVQGRVGAGHWLAVHGCGGVGLSAIMIANSIGANVVAVDNRDDKLAFAQSLGARATVNASAVDNVPQAVRDATGGGAHVSIDALGSPDTCFNSVACLRKRGVHVQVGLLVAGQSQPPVPMDRVIADELRLVGSHGMAAHHYPKMLNMILAGRLDPGRLIGRTITLEESPEALQAMDQFRGTGVTIIDRFD